MYISVLFPKHGPSRAGGFRVRAMPMGCCKIRFVIACETGSNTCRARDCGSARLTRQRRPLWRTTRPPGASAAMLPSQTSALARDRPPLSTSTSLQVRTAVLSLRQVWHWWGQWLAAVHCQVVAALCDRAWAGHQYCGVCDLLEAAQLIYSLSLIVASLCMCGVNCTLL